MMNHSPKKFLIFLFCFIYGQAGAQFVNIPDTNFHAWLYNNGYSGCMNGALLDTTCPDVVNTTKIFCDGKNISDITGIQYFDSLDSLFCGSNNLNFLPPLPNGLYRLDCSDNNLTSLPSLPPFLNYLGCSGNQISALPALPPTLMHLHCGNNLLLAVPSLPTALLNLKCRNNNINVLPVLPSGLVTLDCSYNNLNALPALPATLIELRISNNQFTTLLQPLPSLLETLHCENNLLTSLPTLSAQLIYLNCAGNSLIMLPTLPPGLIGLVCAENQLTSLPALPLTLEGLYCAGNYLTVLPLLPPVLEQLNCDSNQLTSLPVLPPTLLTLLIGSNPITVLPDLPDSLATLEMKHVPVNCLPEIKKINTFLFTGSALTCLPNYIQVGFSLPPLSTLPLCQPSGNCPVFWNVRGNVYNDVNTNCTNNSEDNLAFIPVRLDSAGIFMESFLTTIDGNFSFRTFNGSYTVTIDTTGLPFDVLCPAAFSHTTVISASAPYDSLANFAMQCKASNDFVATGITPHVMFRPGATILLYLNAGDAPRFYGTDCSAATGGTVTAVLSGPVTYLSPAPGATTPASVSGDTIIWSVSDFSLSDPLKDYNILVTVSTAATIGDSVCAQLDIFSPAGDNNPANNSISACYPVVNSFDPNEKYMTPSGAVDIAQQWFSFTVFFQNTGNAPAENIYILDTLSQYLDATSFHFISSSHKVITQVLTGNVLRFNYHHIYLPDSNSNEPGSHGYVHFRVKRKPGLPVGITINNTAYIYFDYNPPIITNTVSAILTTPSAIQVTSLSRIEVFPNPTDGIVQIRTAGFEFYELQLLNGLGQTVIQQSQLLHTNSTTLDLSGLPKGIYLIRLAGKETLMQKLIRY